MNNLYWCTIVKYAKGSACHNVFGLQSIFYFAEHVYTAELVWKGNTILPSFPMYLPPLLFYYTLPFVGYFPYGIIPSLYLPATNAWVSYLIAVLYWKWCNIILVYLSFLLAIFISWVSCMFTMITSTNTCSLSQLM